MNERNWLYLLPSGETAENMKEGCEKIQLATGHNFSADNFRNLVRKEVVIKIDKITYCKIPTRDATEKTLSTRQL
jgi:hypothetical protein